MNSKKRLMFIIEDDYYYITIKVISILVALNCYEIPFNDYRKLSIIIELIKNENNINILNKAKRCNGLDNIEKEKMINIICSAKIAIPTIKRILFFLEKQCIISMGKSLSEEGIKIKLIKSDRLSEILTDDIIGNDIVAVNSVNEILPRLKQIKNSTLIKRISELIGVNIWED